MIQVQIHLIVILLSEIPMFAIDLSGDEPEHFAPECMLRKS